MEFLNEETARTLNQCMYQLHAGIMTPRRKQISTIYSHAALTMPTAYLRLIWAFRARAARQPTSSTATMQTTHIQFSSFLSVASSLTQFILSDLTKLFGTLAMWIGQLLLMYLDFKCFRRWQSWVVVARIKFIPQSPPVRTRQNSFSVSCGVNSSSDSHSCFDWFLYQRVQSVNQ